MTGRYWKYYQNDVRYPEIQRPGALSLLAQGDAGGLDALYQSGLKFRDQFFPALAEKESVLIHGLSRGIPRHFLENDAQYRKRVLNAWAWQHLTGRHWGLYKIFAEYGFPIITLENLKGEYHWAEFDIEVEIPPGVGFSEDVFDLIYWLVFEYKRASAMLRTLRVLKRVRGKIHVAMAILQGERHIVLPPPVEIPVATAPIRALMAVISHETWTINPRPVTPKKSFTRPGQVKIEYRLSEV